MRDVFAKQRPRLLELLAALDARGASLRRDVCGDWAISGKLGHIYAVPEGLQLVIFTGEIGIADSPRRWTGVSQRLGFCRVTQDGDDEGCMILGRLPAAQEAKLIREALGIPKARHLTVEQVASIQRRNAAQSRFQAKKTPLTGAADTMHPAGRFEENLAEALDVLGAWACTGKISGGAS